MAVNKVVYDGETLMDISDSTVTEDDLTEGVTAYAANGEKIVGVNNGVDTSDATATASDIVSGKTAYVNGSKVEGTLVIQVYYTGSSEPSNSLGNDGDLYLVTG